MIKNGIIDAAVIGGAEEILKPLHFLEFAAWGHFSAVREGKTGARDLPALRCPKRRMVLGEGGGIIVIERESLARARGAQVTRSSPVWGRATTFWHGGVLPGFPRDGHPHLFHGLPYGPEAVDLVECHATSTRQGDVEEARALKACFNDARRTVIASFKSRSATPWAPRALTASFAA